jgi:putative ABC transport system ATP-binding protein
LHILGGLDAPDSGSVALEGIPLQRLGDSALTRIRLTRMGFVFQRFHLLPVLSALENVELPMAEAGIGRRERLSRARELLDYVGLSERAGHRATELSGGEMQRVAVARALANRPALLFADEPTGELDLTTGRQVLDLFRRLHQDGMTIIVVTHDEHLAAEASRTVHLLDGQLAGTTSGSLAP